MAFLSFPLFRVIKFMNAIDIIKIAREFTDNHNVLMSRDEWIRLFSLSQIIDTEVNENGIDRDEKRLLQALGQEQYEKLKVVHIDPKIDAREYGNMNGTVCPSSKNVVQEVANATQTRIRLGIAKNNSRVYGALFRYDNETRAKILLSINVSRCWRRFSAVKELAHLLAHNKALDKNTEDSVDLIETAKRARSIILTKSTVDIHDEAAAIFMAMEILLPWSIRQVVIKMHEETNGVSKMNNFQIARAFAIPERLIEIFFEKDIEGTSYCSLSHYINLNCI